MPRRVRRLLAGAVLAGSALVVARVLNNSSSELFTAADDLRRVQPAWVAAAVAAELLSYLALGSAQRRLLSVGRARVNLLTLTAIGIAAQAAANCAPGGVAVSTYVSFRRLRRRGVGGGLCGWMLSVSTLLYAGALALLALIAIQLAGPSAGGIPDLRPVSLVVLAVAVTAGSGLMLHRRALAGRSRTMTPTTTPRMMRLLPSRVVERANSSFQALRQVRPSSPVLLLATGLMTACWLADALCLSAAFYAVGSEPPWRGLLLAYCAAQLAAALPITPGGLGVVEGSLTVALVAYGGGQQSALDAVLLYRLISFWGLLPAGAAAFVSLRFGERHAPQTLTEEAEMT